MLGDFDIEAMLARAPLVKHRPLYLGRALARSLLGDRVSYVPISLPVEPTEPEVRIDDTAETAALPPDLLPPDDV